MARRVVRRLGRLFRPRPEVEVDEELAFHLEERVREYEARGMGPEAARAAALARFGDLAHVQGECTQLLTEERRMERRRDWLGDLRQDLRFGVRACLRAPLFTLLAVATLALGIGANAAVFGVVKSVLLDALPYRDAGRLVRLHTRMLDGTVERSVFSSGAAKDFAERQRSFGDVTAFLSGAWDVTLTGEGEPQTLEGAYVDGRFFRTLGVPVLLGRALAEEDTRPGAPRVVVLTHGTWQRRFGGAPAALGRSVWLDGVAHEVVGVLRPGFVAPFGPADLVLPLDQSERLASPVSARKSHWLGLVGRLGPGQTLEAARREAAAIAAELAREHPDSDAGISYTATPLRDDMVGDTRTPLLVLMASAGLVLLITCANLAGALLSRALTRRKEFAVRLALGAGRGRLVRQMLTESALLGLLGGAAGAGLAALALQAVRGLAAGVLPAYAELALDGQALAFTSGLALLTGLAFGVAPALSVSGSNMQDTLRDDSRGASESRRSRRLRGLLVAGQIALSVSLLVGAGLLVRSLWAMSSAPPGLDPRGVLTAFVQLPLSKYDSDGARAQFYAQLEERLRALPGVSAAATASGLPAPEGSRNGLVIEGRPWPAGEAPPFILYASVSDDYFRTLGIPLRAGRVFGPEDRPDTVKAIVVSEAFARRHFPRGDAVGARVRFGPDDAAPWAQVVGVVGDVRNDPARAVPEPMAYALSRQEPWAGRSLLLRTAGDPLALLAGVQREVAALDGGLALREPATLESVLGQRLAGRRLPVVLMTGFGALALVLAAVGVYAMFASMAAARTQEFGIRMALGASPGGIAGLVLRQGAVWMAVGLAGGAVGVVLVGRALGELLYGVRPLDPLALGATALLLLVCATVALLVPVRRATRVNPASVLH